MSRIGAGIPAGAGVDRRELVLPSPTVPTSFAELRTLTLMGRGDSVAGRWEPYGLEWVYAAGKVSPSTYEVIWKGRIEPRRRVVHPAFGAGS
ncbi:hypothetical protein JD276_11515 [Leucobacter sp. CSA1]|uniref:Uncharacterized protein n=1 Tax=Leucobacter chromiisoli TaxID=2796471 RepID=A0A934UVN4_9MICO|nr:hypothetical protein [Leucobacter chromiisoli]MBK0419661.1 hypothetical protein [Leucobacter chromiisoli]